MMPFDRCILAAQSFPMRAMFEGSFKEGKEKVITLRDVDPSSFALLLDFLYDRSIEITMDNVEALLDLSGRYGVSLLRCHCCELLARSANIRNSFTLLAVVDRYDCHQLRKELLAYVLRVRSCSLATSAHRDFENRGCSCVTGSSICRIWGNRQAVDSVE